jgi:hypothetical protein
MRREISSWMFDEVARVSLDARHSGWEVNQPLRGNGEFRERRERGLSLGATDLHARDELCLNNSISEDGLYSRTATLAVRCCNRGPPKENGDEVRLTQASRDDGLKERLG